MGLKIDRYVIREFMGPFLVCVAGFTILLISGYLFELTDLIFVKKVAISTVLRLLWYKLPSVVALTLPVGVLFGVFLSLGGLAKGNEITVMRCAGESFLRLIAPLLVMGLLVSAITYWLNEQIVPAMNHKESTILRQIVYKDALPTVEEQVFFRDPQDRFFYIRRIDRKAKQLYDIMVYLPEPAADYPALITAKEGTYEETSWHLRDGVKRDFDDSGYVVREMKSAELEISSTEQVEGLFGEQKTTSEMNRSELKEHIVLFRQSGLKVSSFEVDYHFKLSLPFASLIFSLIAAPLSCRAGRSGKFAGAIVGLVVMFLYYIVSSVCRSMGANDLLPPLISAWIGNITFGVIAALAIFHLER